MSRWTHCMCRACWDAKNPEREPLVYAPVDREKCCWCGAETLDGIYVREDPAKLKCRGEHEEARPVGEPVF